MIGINLCLPSTLCGSYAILTAVSERLHMEMICENMNWIRETSDKVSLYNIS